MALEGEESMGWSSQWGRAEKILGLMLSGHRVLGFPVLTLLVLPSDRISAGTRAATRWGWRILAPCATATKAAR